MRISDWSSDVCSSDLDDMTELDALHDAGDDLSDAVLEFLILPLTLGVADLLENDLLGGLRIDAPQIDRRQRINDEVADLCTRLQLLRGLGIDLLEIILNHFDHFNDTPQAQVAAVRIRSEEHTSELQSLMRISYAVFCL